MARISSFWDADLEEYSETVAVLEIAMAIRNPEDDYNPDIGKTIAMNRLDHDNDFNIFEGYYDTLKNDIFLKSDFIYGQMDLIASWVKDNQKLFY